MSNRPEATNASKFVCEHPWTHFEVNNPDGRVTMCCDNNTVLGNVNKGSIPEIWNGQGYRDIRRRMRDEGAHVLCPHTCPVLNGAKTYQNLEWYDELTQNNPARLNAEKNKTEFASGALSLESLPRWMRFTYSYLCNLDCYHCYQREDAVQNVKLPEHFMEEMRALSNIYQVLFPFGGEPFLFKPVLDILENAEIDAGCRYFFVTNATLLTDRVIELLRQRNIGMIAVSLDSADSPAFEKLRVRGRRASWDIVMANLKKLQVLKREKRFRMPMSMTLNAQNFDQIEKFVDLCLSFDGEPQVILVTNPYQTLGFQREFLHFTSAQFDTMYGQIERAAIKVRDSQLVESVASLNNLRAELIQHRKSDNSISYYASKKFARRVYHAMPTALQRPLKRLVQYVRVERLRRYASASSGMSA